MRPPLLAHVRRPLEAAGAVAVIAVYVLFSVRDGSGGAAAPPPVAFGITGYLVASPDPKLRDQPAALLRGRIFVPGVSVRLIRGATLVEAVRTDLSGRFVFSPQRPGTFQICWKAPGWLSGCAPLRLGFQHVNLEPFALRIPAGSRTLFGRVRFADGTLPRTLEPLANANAFAVVQPTNAAGRRTAPLAYVNNYGEYVLPRLTASTRRLVASIESERRTVAAGLGPAGSARRRDIVLRNRQPVLVGTGAGRPQGIVARALTSGNRWTVAPGEQVELSAHPVDPNGDALRYRWILPDGSSVLPSAGGQTITQTIPNAHGTYEFTVVAFDRRGGYTKEKIALGTRGVLFGGTVVATTGGALPGTEVEVNGKRTSTNGQGRFVLYVDEAPRYVLNLRRPAFQLVSRIYDNTVSGGRWEMIPASVHTVDPRLPIVVQEERRKGDCPGSLSDRAVQRPPDRTCGPGLRVEIPPDSLVDGSGNPPSGPVDVELATVDLRAPDSMPGDYTARTTAGTFERMESYGAGSVEIRSGGAELNLAPGATARVSIPIDRDQLAAGSPPATIPLLQYDETTGIWNEEGTLTRVGDSYVGTVRHFSDINADLTFSNYACLRVETPLMPPDFDLEATITPAGGAPKVLTRNMNNSSQRFHVVWRLPVSTPVELRAFDRTTNPPTLIPLLVSGASANLVTANSGGLQSPQNPPQPAYPYTACQAAVELIPFRLPPATQDTFLAGLYSFNASNLRELDALNPAQAGTVRGAAAAYYQTVDPQNLRTTLAAFRTVNGFGSGTGVEFDAQYSNAGDLGFGRDMHCRKNGLDVACYVTNYGDRFTDNVTDATNAARDHAVPGSATPVATVGMEYTRVENVSGGGFQQATAGGDLRIVKFFVFVHDPANPANTTRAVAADLDGYGARPVPALCMVCHGGRFPSGVSSNAGAPNWNVNNANSANLGSNFIPFDFISFELPTVTLPNGTTVNLRTDQEADFKALNQQIVLATNPPQATVDVVTDMYAGGSATQITNFVVPGWQGSTTAANQEATYRGVVAPSCRSCHISQGPSFIAWNTASQFGTRRFQIDNLVCNTHFMPHAVETHNRFWLSTSPHQPQELETFLTAANGGTALGTACTP